MGYKHPKLTEVICQFDDLDEVDGQISGDVLFSCMGTTLKQAGGKEQQYKVDFTYQYEFARIASKNGVKQYVLVSSVSAHPKSRFFYLRMKGELEQAVQQLPFEEIRIIQPSGLKGKREHQRHKEEIGMKITDGLLTVLPFFKKYKSIPAKTVAKAMINLSKQQGGDRIRVEKLDQLFQIAEDII